MASSQSQEQETQGSSTDNLHCGTIEIRQGSSSRVRAHLLGIKVHNSYRFCNILYWFGGFICKKTTAADKLNMKQLEEAYEQKKLESQAKDVELPCEAGVGFKKRKTILAPIERAFGVEIRDQLDQEIARMFYIGGLPFNLAKNPHHLRAFQFAANNKFDGYVPPGYNKLRTTLLQKEKENVHRLFDPLRSTWKEKGVTIVSDGWSDPTRKPLINFMATSSNGPLFIKAVNCFGEVKDRFFISELMKDVINEIGHTNAAGEIIESQFPHIYWTPCVVHTLNLALKNICSPRNVETNQLTYEQCSWIKEVHEDALTIKNFIMNHNMRLSIFTKFTPLRLLSVANTRFASIIVMLKRLKLIKMGLQAMVISDEWSIIDYDTDQANFVKELVLNDDWWDKVAYILSFIAPIYEMIRVCDTDKPCLHLVYETWDAMIEKVKIEIYKKEKRPTSQISYFYDVVHRILVARWGKNNTPLHCLAHSLHPRYYSDAWLLEDSTRCFLHRDVEISQERMKCFRSLFPNDDEYSKVLDEYAILLGQPSSSSCAKRNWSTYAFIHSLKRNKLTTSRAQDLESERRCKDVGCGWRCFDSMEDVGFLEVADLSLDESEFENDFIIDN
ncbi:hypothetical protein OSB04_019392 [Centaurea solstitialis]|uniref:DUF659 domain-containing protein n=1 Tax=Centaurea solstitialis TaxID=347529 RepID=A0AA38SRW7_9ASTR|nr:hypothetical protein OSB04_019392 [Centaurea solstitialis]